MAKKFFLAILLLLPMTKSEKPRPNFVVIITDDQDVLLNGLDPMSKTKKYIAEGGVTFVNAYATSPICCPSRSSIFTGLYLHNHGTRNNSFEGGCNGIHWRRNLESKTFGSVLHAAGYRTFYAGKYLNQYGHKKSGGIKHVPEGWDWWVGLVGNSVYYNFTLSVNGSGHRWGDDASDYLTDVLTRYSLQFLTEIGREQSFLMVISTPAPHEPFMPAVRHRGKFSGLKAPRTANFNRLGDDTKHWLLRLPPSSLPAEVVDRIDEIFRNRWETLLAVDEMLESIVLKLKQLNIYENTYLIFTSDNGFHMGQFTLPWDKRQPYETDIKIPLMMAGPQLPKDRLVEYAVLNIDLAPTILDLSGTDTSYRMDGESFFPYVNEMPGKLARREFLIEYRGEGSDGGFSECYRDGNVKLCTKTASCKCFDSRNNTYNCIRRIGKDVNEIFCKFQDDERFAEMYDLTNDPYQIRNLVRHVESKHLKEYDEMLDCCDRMILAGKALNECFRDKASPIHNEHGKSDVAGMPSSA